MPHFQNTTFGGSVVASTITIPLTAGDGRIADIDFESSNNFADGAFATDYNPGVIPYQITMYNLYSSGPKGCFTWQAGAQFGLIQAYCTVPSVAGYIATFLNVTENIPGGYTGNLFNNLNYQAIIGSYFQGGGLVPHGLGVETIRISAGQDIVVSNNTIRDADTQGAVLKIHNGTKGSVSTWSGTYTQNVMVTDNLFSGTSGGNLVETAPQNSGDDERLRYIVLERNYFNAPTSAYGGTQFLLSAQNTTVRDNVFNMTGAAIKQYPAYGVLAGQRGSLAPITQYVEVYNNSFYGSADTFGSQTNIAFAVAGDLVSAASNSVAENNLAYMLTTGGGSTVQNTGTGNTVSNNTATRTNNPAFTNGTGLYSIMSDFKPTAQYTGALNGVPVIYDALGVAWSPTWDLGAVHH